jgi:O-succinylbenzoic acid--CoA ligase
VPNGEPGVVRLAGMSLMRGYLDSLRGPDDFVAYFDTEDIGYIDSAGRLNLTGRVSARMNIGNEKVSPEEVESVIATIESVVDCAVGPIGDDVLGEVAAAVLVIRASSDAAAVAHAVRTACDQALSRAKRPRHFFVVEAASIPKTEYGKLNRRELPKLLAALVERRRSDENVT